MIVLREGVATSQISDPYIRDLVALRWSQILAGEPYDYNRHGYMVVMESGDTVEALEQEIGLPILHGLFDDLPFGHPDFTPCFDILEDHCNEQDRNESSTVYEMVFISNDDGFATTVIVPAAEGTDSRLLAMCRSFATPAVTCG